MIDKPGIHSIVIPIEKPGIYNNIPAAEYHADPVIKPSLSSGVARTLITKTPAHGWTDHPRLNPAFENEESNKFDLGSAAHALILEGEDRMVFIPYDDYKKNIAQELRDAARAAGKHPLLEKYRDRVYLMRESFLRAVANCPDFSGLTLANGKAEETLVWQEEGGIYLRCRPDWHDDEWTLVLDLKTTDASAHPSAWVKTMMGIGGDVEAAFYLRGVKALTKKAPKWVFGVQEVSPPYAVSFIGLPSSFLEFASEKVEHAVNVWRHCVTTDTWPAYTNRICWVEPPAWALTQWAERDNNAIGIPYDVAKLWGERQMQEDDPI